MKIIVSPAQNYGVMLGGGEWAHSHRPSCVTQGPLISTRISTGQFNLIVSNLSDEATDTEFEKFLKESESPQLAFDAFESRYSNDPQRRRVDDPEALKQVEKEAAAAKLKADAKAKEEADAKEELRLKAEAKAKEDAAAKLKLEADLKEEADAKTRADAKAKEDAAKATK